MSPSHDESRAPIFAVVRPRDAREDALVVALAAGFAALALWNVWTDYSYWVDEMFSVAASRAPWDELLNVWLLRDVHPPLYQAALKLWIGAFGASENATRALSEACALAALAVLVAATWRDGFAYRIAALGFFGAATAFAFYAQETRSYALLLLLATLATVSWRNPATPPGGRQASHHAALLLLSLTHYFGLLLAAIMLAADFAGTTTWRARGRLAAVGLAMLAWPVFHVVAGTIAVKAGGSFWIQSSGLASSVAAAADGVASLPYAIARASPLAAVAVGAVGLALSVLGLRGVRRARFAQAARLILLIGATAAIVALIDLRTPVSTPRNYIVLLPAVALLFATVVEGLGALAERPPARAALALGVTAFVAAGAAQSAERLREKWRPLQNIKGLVVALDGAGLCQPHCRVFRAQRELRPYMEILGVPLAIRGVNAATAQAGGDDTPLIAWNADPANFATPAFAGWACLEPLQAWPLSTFVLLPEPAQAPGLRACASARR